MERQIIRIDEDKCNGCGLCIPDCPEGALAIIDGKARLVGESFCDGLGACIGRCPQGAITIETRQAETYNERAVMDRIASKGINTIIAHLEHLKNHGQWDFLEEALSYCREKGLDIEEEFGNAHSSIEESDHRHEGHACPGSRVLNLEHEPSDEEPKREKRNSRLSHWPVQISLVPPSAPFFENADILLTADCVPFAYADFHEELLRGRICLVGCPKLDDADRYLEKLSEIFRRNKINSITVAHMEVPCCFGMVQLAMEAVARSGKEIPISTCTISIAGEPVAID